MRISPTPKEIDFLISKFIINLPPSELKQNRIWFHLEKSFYYFIDEIAHVDAMTDFQMHNKQIKYFFSLMVEQFPSFVKLDSHKIVTMINDGYSKTPVYGVVIFNLEETKILLVESQKPAQLYGIPKGKINQGQTPLQCTIRQVQEEVGINLQLDPTKKIEVNFSKNYTFFLCKIQENNINVSFNKNSANDKLTGKKKICKQVKSLAWISLQNPGVRLNVATKKTLQKLNSQKAGKKKFLDNQKTSKNGMYKEIVNPFDNYKINKKFHQNLYLAA